MGKKEDSVAKKAEVEEDIFDSTETTEELPDKEEISPDVEEDEMDSQPFVPKVSKESPKEKLERKGLKAEKDGKTLTIKEHFFTRPRLQGANGEVLKPKETQDGSKEFYPGKLGIRFEEDNIVEYYPSFKYFVNDGKVSDTAKIFRTGENSITKIFNLAIKTMGKPEDEVSDQEFYEWLAGKKVKISVVKGVYLGRAWFRNDIVEFI